MHMRPEIVLRTLNCAHFPTLSLLTSHKIMINRELFSIAEFFPRKKKTGGPINKRFAGKFVHKVIHTPASPSKAPEQRS